MNKHNLLCFTAIFICAACGPAPQRDQKIPQTAKVLSPSQDAFYLLFENGGHTEEDIAWISAQCADTASEHIPLFTKRVMSQFTPRIACSADVAGTSTYGPYGTVTMSLTNAVMMIETDEIGGIIQTVDITPEARLTRSWFEASRADFANGYDVHMDWETDDDPHPLIETYWAPDLGNVQVTITLREDNSIKQIWFSDPN